MVKCSGRCLTPGKMIAMSRPMTEAQIKAHVLAWIGGPVSPENPKLNAMIVNVADQGIRIKIPGRELLISFPEIIAADKVIPGLPRPR